MKNSKRALYRKRISRTVPRRFVLPVTPVKENRQCLLLRIRIVVVPGSTYIVTLLSLVVEVVRESGLNLTGSYFAPACRMWADLSEVLAQPCLFGAKRLAVPASGSFFFFFSPAFTVQSRAKLRQRSGSGNSIAISFPRVISSIHRESNNSN